MSPPPLALAYHGVASVPLHEDPHGLFVAPDALRRQIALLRRWGYELVTFGELAARVAAGTGAGAAALTFDDGLVDNLETLVPLLREEGATGTAFVATGWLGEPYPYRAATRLMTAAEVRELAGSGVLEVGGHSDEHLDLSRLDRAGAAAQLRRGRAALQELTGAPVDVLAYPFGGAGAATFAAAADAGFRAACRTSANGAWDRPLDLPRQDMDNAASALGLRLKRDDRYEPLMRRRPVRALRRARRLALRAVR
jgi:peptidoglycan/xylan/chitin deacetylase (PgdA/CDA1 family)